MNYWITAKHFAFVSPDIFNLFAEKIADKVNALYVNISLSIYLCKTFPQDIYFLFLYDSKNRDIDQTLYFAFLRLIS